MIKIASASMIIIATTPTLLMSHTNDKIIDGMDCQKIHAAMNNHIETIYLVQMAEFWATRTNNVQRNPELSNGISVAFEEVVEALGHYDGSGTRRAIDVVLKFCPL